MNFLKRLLGRPSRPVHSFPRDNKGRGLRAGLGVADLFSELERRGARYLVLRWFDGLPQGETDGDIDLLIDDRDAAQIADLFEHAPDAIQCDVFSVSGLPGTSYRGLPYLPPDKAAGMLERAVRLEDCCMVPGADDHFHSLAYHAVYQKGLKCGLPTALPGLTPNATPGHDYVHALGALAAQLEIDVPINLDDLDHYLSELGWCPLPDMVETLALTNAWYAARIEQDDR